ncbi:MAG: GNAT family N-acetyltransferase [Candidatus Methanofastidiosia archaeon]|jgi:ribosomal protein S18 acetylase RimI-like enzyme
MDTIDTIDIVTAAESHIPGIVNIWKELMDYHEDMDPFFARSDNGHVHFGDHVHELITKDDAQVSVAVYNKSVIGYSIAMIHMYPPIFKERTAGFISDVAVKSEYRRQGIGEKLLLEMVQWFSSKGITRIELRVALKNEIGYKFWKKHGFKEYMRILYQVKKK